MPTPSRGGPPRATSSCCRVTTTATRARSTRFRGDARTADGSALVKDARVPRIVPTAFPTRTIAVFLQGGARVVARSTATLQSTGARPALLPLPPAPRAVTEVPCAARSAGERPHALALGSHAVRAHGQQWPHRAGARVVAVGDGTPTVPARPGSAGTARFEFAGDLDRDWLSPTSWST